MKGERLLISTTNEEPVAAHPLDWRFFVGVALLHRSAPARSYSAARSGANFAASRGGIRARAVEKRE